MSQSNNHPRPPFNPDVNFSGYVHAYVCGVIAAALMASESFTVEVDSSTPEVIVRFGPRRFSVLVSELQ